MSKIRKARKQETVSELSDNVMQLIDEEQERAAHHLRTVYQAIKNILEGLNENNQRRIINAITLDTGYYGRNGAADHSAAIYSQIIKVNVGKLTINLVWSRQGLAVGSGRWRFSRAMEDGAMLSHPDLWR